MSQSDHPCCGVIEEVQHQARRRRANRPQPWIALKFTVGLSFLIVGYTTYVYVGRFCKDMIMKSSSALGDQATGVTELHLVAFLVVFCFMLFFVMWSYILVITTGPGHAREYTKTTLRPGHDRSFTPNNDGRGTSYELAAPAIDLSRPSPHKLSQNHNPNSSSFSGNGQSVASQASATASFVAKVEENSQANIPGPEEAHVFDALAAPGAPPFPETATLPTYANPASSVREFNTDRSSPKFTRRPLMTPVLLPERRYCDKCKIVKPPRAHHCRACGTCILKYDHHCPWIGHCVGAFNHKFFINFLQWASIFCLWTFSTLLGFVIKSQLRSPAPELDSNKIAAVVLYGLFGIFCIMVLSTQLHLTLLNQTTVESLHSRSMRDREQDALSDTHRWYEIGAKRRTRKQWDNEWGEIGKEGNLWWLGSRRVNWEAVMGRNTSPTNPRFDAEGRWRRRQEWPAELQ
ncbi:zf-DHHC-domain-containing protein [Melanogaster broomeanus]|nr:zf-DHHC-domain-containing protein [Melanogaster broomeanus]